MTAHTNAFTAREFGLLSFNFDIDYATADDISHLKLFSSGICSRIERKLVQKFPFLGKNYFVKNEMHGFLSDNCLRDNCYYDGYWQTYRYLEVSKDFLLSRICLNNFSTGNEFYLKQIMSTKSVSLHIRRGDYISIKKNSDIFHICTIEYFNKAIEFIEKNVLNPQFFVFSDDIEWAKLNFIGSKYTFVEGNKAQADMYLMSRCKHNIIANSTFSWWGAWLNTNSDNIVIAPNLWYVGDLNNNNFIPKKWILE